MSATDFWWIVLCLGFIWGWVALSGVVAIVIGRAINMRDNRRRLKHGN